MPHFKSNRDESVRLFANPVLEFFSHTHPATPLLVYIPVVAYTFFISVNSVGLSGASFTFAGGLLIWTLLEYFMHRFVFHFQPKSETGKKFHFMFHGVHHDYPRDKTRLVMSLLMSVPLAIFFYVLFYILFGVYHYSAYSGILFGYVCYDSIHYATHHFKFKGGFGKFLKEYHLRHHYNDENTAFGVSNPLWDYVFFTTPRISNQESNTLDEDLSA